jgi:hypothetical protein
MTTLKTWIAVGVAAVAFVSLAVAQGDLNPKSRQELKREDLTGTNMEVVISVIEPSPANFSPVTFIMVRKRSTCFRGRRLKPWTGSKSS